MINTRHEITIAAPVESVWRLHTDIAAWPSWNSGIDLAALEGELKVGASFRWLTHGLDITSTVTELEPCLSIAWGGPAAGIDGTHRWTFQPCGGGTETRVVTEESWAGAPVDADPAGMLAALEQSLVAWLEELKRTAEQER
ncbi:polyketide cyclase/dehydrase/lipid transport protein [Streptomyces sp. SLBN-118]|uniref:SRPBCC family protein n=1 Tax=Streptomyces sp. SLBN-118 TaxID=2768454 RepID=UPI00114FA796|nr:SRPBCC family protein [Streptomyces sp. SLBN-118]TQK45132.1 polyketide cyclase/dehydrase/lipid transport protein [Streptomyces sp. SLBN-118]